MKKIEETSCTGGGDGFGGVAKCGVCGDSGCGESVVCN